MQMFCLVVETPLLLHLSNFQIEQMSYVMREVQNYINASKGAHGEMKHR